MRHAQDLDPLSVIINTRVASTLYYAHRYDEAIAQLRKTLELDSTNSLVYAELARANLGAKRCAEAVAATRFIAASLPNPETAVRGYALGQCGRRTEALSVLGELKQHAQRGYVSAAKIAVLHAALGVRDSTFAWRERAYRERDAYLAFLKVEPMYDGVRADPRFARFVQRVGLERSP